MKVHTDSAANAWIGPLYLTTGPPREFGRYREYPAGHFDDPANLEQAKVDALDDYEREKSSALDEAGITLSEPSLRWHISTRLMRAPWFMCSMGWVAKELK